MARVTVEDCMRQVNNRFSLVHLAAKRVRQLREGAPPHLGSKNKEVVLALREIASGDVFPVSADEAEKGRLEAEAIERERLATLAAAQEEAAASGAPVDDSDEEA